MLGCGVGSDAAGRGDGQTESVTREVQSWGSQVAGDSAGLWRT